MFTNDHLICPECGASNAEGPLCSNCGDSIVISCDQLPNLLIRRLLLAGYVELTPSEVGSQALAELTELSESFAELDCEKILMFPNLLSTSQSIFTLSVVAVARGSEKTVDLLRSCASNILREAVKLPKRLKRPRIMKVLIRVYIAYSDALSSEQVKAHRLPAKVSTKRVLRKGFPPISAVGVRFFPMDCQVGKAHFTSRYYQPDKEAKAALMQLQERIQTKVEQPFFKKYVRLLFTKPLKILTSYLEFLSLVGQPDLLAHQIISGKMHAKKLFEAVAVSAVIAGLGAQFLGVDIFAVDVGISLLNSILEGLIFMALYLLTAVFTHFPLRIAGGHAPFRSTFLATTYVSAVGYPIIVGLVGVLMILGENQDKAWDMAQSGGFGWISLMVLSAVHGLSWTRTFLISFVILPVALILIVIGALFIA